jgi:3,4-dihydroxy 2-butanone 4-phosphate synthase/GTP cyclohydrolase II
MVLVLDSEDREDEGDLMVPASHVSAEVVNFMARQACGLVCMPCDSRRLDELSIGPMVVDNTCAMSTAFTVSIDWRFGGSGISAQDRAATVRAVLDPRSTPADFSRPGHVFPLRARPGGVLERPGHTEAAVDLARLAGLFPAAHRRPRRPPVGASRARRRRPDGLTQPFGRRRPARASSDPSAP